MRVYQKKGSEVWLYEFQLHGQRYHRSTGETNENKAKQIANGVYTDILRGDTSSLERKPSPTLKQFRGDFLTQVESEKSDTPNTLTFYTYCFDALLQYEPFAKARLDQIDEKLISRFTVWALSRPKDRNQKKMISVATINRWRSTLKKALRMAKRWKMVSSVPEIPRLKGERGRAFTFSEELLKKYDTLAPEPLKSCLRMGCEIGICETELIELQKSDVHMEEEPDQWGHYGYLSIRKGKTAFRKRNLPVTERVQQILLIWLAKSKSNLVFTTGDDKSPISNFHLIHQQEKMRKLLKLPDDAVFHASRHTALTNLGLEGTDAFTLQRAAGHASITTTLKYVHPIPESTSAAFQKKTATEVKRAKKPAGKVVAMPAKAK